MGLIRVLDMEATGLHATAQIVEVGLSDFDTETGVVERPVSWLCRVTEMPPDTRAVHHIRIEDALDFPPYDRRVLYEEAVRAGVDAWAAHNIDLESRYIVGDLPLVDTYKAALRIWPEAPSHGLFALLYWLEDQGLVEYDRTLAHPPHRAGPDAYAGAVLLGALQRAGVTGLQLKQWTCEPRLLPRCPIGKYRQQPWAACDWGFLEWILSKGDMDPDIKWNAARELDRRQQGDDDE